MQPAYKKLLEKQGYRLIGQHSAVKICEWTKKSLRNEGVCYKQKFYGIQSHRCCQMTPALNFCNFGCVFCWRERNNSLFREIDTPENIINKALSAQRSLLSGFGGLKEDEKYKEAQKPAHFAISLSGEPTYYPRLNELIKALHKREISTFLVSNGSQPDVLKSIEKPTQIYISLDSPNKQVFLDVNRPDREESWTDLMKTLDIIKAMRGKARTAIRITMVKGYNDVHPEQYAALLEKSQPLFVEVKGYMFVGASRQRLSIANMPRHEEVRAFAESVCSHCTYRFIDEQPRSRVVLLMQEDNAERIMKF